MPISTNTFLLEIRAALGPISRDAQQSTRAWDLYEVLVLGAVVGGARRANGQVELLDTNGNPATRYLFRSSPGPLARPSQQFTHAEIRFAGQPALEAHTGIWVVGKSQLPHECDCAVVSKAEADAVRSAGRTPLWGQLLIHAEAKYYARPVPFGHGRAFLGLGLDLGWKGSTLVINRQSQNAMQLVRRRKAAAFKLTPGDTDDMYQLECRFQQRFARYRRTGSV
jgi:hypothetical protein